METIYYLYGRQILKEFCDPPRVNDELSIDGKWYRVERVVRHKPDCPPDFVTVHLVMSEAEYVWPAGHP